MKKSLDKRTMARRKRARRVRRKVFGTAERPRLSVYRSNTGLYVQLTDDVTGVSLAGVSSKHVTVPEGEKNGKIGVAKAVGKLIAEKAKEKNITNVVFDRSGYLYHGRVKAVAEGAREAGLTF